MAAKTKFRGSFTALVTPFKNGSVDEAAFRGLVSWQITEGTHGLVPVGTTGESPTLSHDEHNASSNGASTRPRDGRPSSRVRAPIRPRKPSNSPSTRRRQARMPCWW